MNFPRLYRDEKGRWHPCRLLGKYFSDTRTGKYACVIDALGTIRTVQARLLKANPAHPKGTDK